jgi:hypothetical protein
VRSREIWDAQLTVLSAVSLSGEEVSFPADGILIGGIGEGQLPECAVWRKLIDTDLGSLSRTLILAEDPEATHPILLASAPRSLHSQVYITAMAQEWAEALSPGPFAILWDGPRFVHGVVGKPTEDAWENFADAARRFSR